MLFYNLVLQALTLLSRPNFLVGAVRTWYSSEANHGAIDYLTLCLSPKADQVPQLTPFLANPLAPIPSDQPISPGDPAESYKVCNPKPFHDLWLYTALPIAVDVDNAVSLFFIPSPRLVICPMLVPSISSGNKITSR